MNRVDIAIVGGGMVGLLLAAALEESGLRLAIVEPAEPAAPPETRQTHADGEAVFEPRVSALTLASRQMLQQLGAWQQIAAEHFCAYTDMEVWDGESNGRIHFNATELMQRQLGFIIENSRIAHALRLLSSCNPQLQWYCPDSVEALNLDSATPVLKLASGDQIEATLVVGADGASSRIRQWAGLDTREWDYGQHALVTTVRTEKPLSHTAWQRFTDTGPLAFLPLGSDLHPDHYASIVWSTTPEHVEELKALDDEAFRRALGVASEFRLGEILWSDRRFSFPLRQRHATAYWRPGVVLIGDAAHTIHPLAGQGVNLGLLDAATLAEELMHALQRGDQLDSGRALRRYQRRRQGHNLSMMAAMEGFRRLFGDAAPPLRWLRAGGLDLVNRLSYPKLQIMRQATGLDGDLPRIARRHFKTTPAEA